MVGGGGLLLVFCGVFFYYCCCCYSEYYILFLFKTNHMALTRTINDLFRVFLLFVLVITLFLVSC